MWRIGSIRIASLLLIGRRLLLLLLLLLRRRCLAGRCAVAGRWWWRSGIGTRHTDLLCIRRTRHRLARVAARRRTTRLLIGLVWRLCLASRRRWTIATWYWGTGRTRLAILTGRIAGITHGRRSGTHTGCILRWRWPILIGQYTLRRTGRSSLTTSCRWWSVHLRWRWPRRLLTRCHLLRGRRWWWICAWWWCLLLLLTTASCATSIRIRLVGMHHTLSTRRC